MSLMQLTTSPSQISQFHNVVAKDRNPIHRERLLQFQKDKPLVMSYQRARNDSFELRSFASENGSDDELSVPGQHFSSPDSLVSDNAQADAISLETLDNTLSEVGVEDIMHVKRQKKLKYIHGLGLVIGLQIGSGIFASPNQVSSHAGSPGMALLVWIVAGMLAWTGASCYAELGAAIPLNGGTQAYLGEIFGPLAAFTFTWSTVTILKPGSAAIIALVCGEYLGKGLGINSTAVEKSLSLAGLVVIGGLNSYSSRSGAKAGKWFLILKFILLVFIFVVGLIGITKYENESFFQAGFWTGTAPLASTALALYGGLWAYDGWDNLNFVTGEMENAERDLPLVINSAMPIVIVSYVVVNVMYFGVLSKVEIEQATSVALTMAYKVMGAPGRVIASLAIASSCLGALNATVFSSGHLIQTAAKERHLPAIFSHYNTKRHTPVNAIILQTFCSALYIVVGEFRSLIAFYGAAGYIFYLWSVIGLMVLRFKKPDLPRPWKVLPTTPLFFSAVAIYLVFATALAKPIMFLGMVAFILLAVPIYFVRSYCAS